MKTEYLPAYATATSAHEMFKAIQNTPLYSSLHGYDPLGRVLDDEIQNGCKGAWENKKR